MDDYLSAIDDISKESYVDNARLGCVGASYMVFGVLFGRNTYNRFKTFIAHDGVFTQSMFGTTESSSAIGICGPLRRTML
jgi:hypothetical protein